jgi:hypothetical protein
MRNFLKSLVIAASCALLLVGPVLADDPEPDPDSEPTDPFGGTMSAREETVLTDWSRALILFKVMLPWVIR